LNWWGVDLQKLDRFDDAAEAFALALKLNPQNVSVEINSAFNRTRRAGAAAPAKAKGNLEERVGKYRDWNSLLAANGPIDDPEICFRLAQTFAAQSLFRQSALQLIRVLQLDPDNLDARFLLAGVFLAGNVPDKTLEAVGEIRSRQTSHPLSSTNLVELVRLESTAHFNKGDVATAEKMLLDAHRQYPKNPSLSDALFQMYVQANRLTNALSTVEESLKLDPGNTAALLNKAYVCMKLEDYDGANAAVNAVLKKDPANAQALLDKGAICIQTKAYKDAVAPLNQLLKLQPDNRVALMNRAIANLQSDQLDAAQRDYETLQKLVPTLYRVYYGLGEIASRRKDVTAAVKNYELYLKYVPPDAHKEAEEVSERLKQLKAGRSR
jgi:tetratricopeptide (TPR) repeat protein